MYHCKHVYTITYTHTTYTHQVINANYVYTFTSLVVYGPRVRCAMPCVPIVQPHATMHTCRVHTLQTHMPMPPCTIKREIACYIQPVHGTLNTYMDK